MVFRLGGGAVSPAEQAHVDGLSTLRRPSKTAAATLTPVFIGQKHSEERL